MIIRQIPEKHWENVFKYITTEGRAAPQSLQFDVDVRCNGKTYILRVQPVKKRQIAVLQAVESCPANRPGGHDYRLVQEIDMLSALLELVVYRTVGQS